MSENAFGYLLNSMENAGSKKCPADHGYAERRRAVLDHEQSLRSRLKTAKDRITDLEGVLEPRCPARTCWGRSWRDTAGKIPRTTSGRSRTTHTTF